MQLTKSCVKQVGAEPKPGSGRSPTAWTRRASPRRTNRSDQILLWFQRRSEDVAGNAAEVSPVNQIRFSHSQGGGALPHRRLVSIAKGDIMTVVGIECSAPKEDA
jgi:hypothetical protein